MGHTDRTGTRRADFLRGTAALGAGLALVGRGVEPVQAAGKGQRNADVARAAEGILATLLGLERLMTTLYYGGLTARAIMRASALAGPSGDPRNPGLPPGGHPQQVRYLQAALDAEAKHAAALVGAGAVSPHARFLFPVETFGCLGSPLHRASFLGVVDILETVCVGAYAAAVVEFIHLGRPDLAATAARIMGVESEHRTLGRVIAGLAPANSHTLETAPFAAVADATREITPFLTGSGYLFATGATRTLPLPSAAAVARVVAGHGTRLVPTFALTPTGGHR